MVEKFTNFILKWSKGIIAVTLVLTVALFFVMKGNSRMETDLDEYMPKEHPAFVYSDKMEDLFNIKDGIMIAVENPNGIYNHGTLLKIKKLTKKLQRMKQIKKADVTSLYTAENIVGKDGSIEVESFYKEVPESKAEFDKIKQAVKGNEMIYKRLVSEDGKVALVVARTNVKFTQEFYHSLIKIAKSFEGPEKIHIAGTPIVEGTLAFLGPKDMKRMVPIVVLIIVFILFLVLGSFRNLFFNFMVVVLSTIWVFGAMALVGIPIYAVSTMIPVMLIAIGVADGIHIYNHLGLYLKKKPDATKEEAVRELISSMWKPIVITSVTTAVGFISLLTSQVYPIKYFGLFTAFGVMMAMVFSLMFIPAGISIFGISKKLRKVKDKSNDDKPDSHSWFYSFADGVMKYRKGVVIATLLIVAVSIFGTSKVWINSSFLEKFERDSDIVKTDTFINSHFGGTNTLNVVLSAKTKDRIKDPEVLKLISNIQKDVATDKISGASFSLADYMLRMNKVMNDDKDEFYIIPATRELVAQYLLLYEMSGDPDNIWKVVDDQYKEANISIQLRSDNSKDLKRVMAIVERSKDKMKELGISMHYAGSGYKALVFTGLILDGQIQSIIISLFLIIFLLAMQFKSIRVGVIATVPIIITTAISFGAMGLLNIPLSTTTALVSSVAIGIGIDYAVHFIEMYKRFALESGDIYVTVRKTMNHSGRAILFNAIVVIIGFLVLLFSVFPPNRALGSLVALNMFTSLVGTVTIMLVLLYFSKIYLEKKKIKN